MTKPKNKKRKPNRLAQKHETRARTQRKPERINADENRALRAHLVYMLGENGSHLPFDKVVADWPARLRGVQPVGAAHTAWQLLEHLRIAQWDILEFSRDAKHVSPEFPAGYWPATAEPPDTGAWDKSIAAFRAHHAEMVKLVKDPATDLFARIPWGDGQTILREALVSADHASYHVGQLVLLRRMLGIWKEAGFTI